MRCTFCGLKVFRATAVAIVAVLLLILVVGACLTLVQYQGLLCERENQLSGMADNEGLYNGLLDPQPKRK